MARYSSALRKQAEYYEELEYRPLAKQEAKRISVAKQEKKGFMRTSFLSAVLGAITIATLAVQFVSIEIGVLASQKRVEKLTKEVYVVKRENEVLESDIRNFMTLDDVKEKALALGMEYQSKENTIYYTKSEREYVRQDEALPVR